MAVLDAIMKADVGYMGKGVRKAGRKAGVSAGVTEGRQHRTLHGTNIRPEIRYVVLRITDRNDSEIPL
uniref:Uncharacterized protein n=1 Tax=Theropithecus gelada TaxID=9565 RepID=A0A8D2K7Z2_THEGE